MRKSILSFVFLVLIWQPGVVSSAEKTKNVKKSNQPKQSATSAMQAAGVPAATDELDSVDMTEEVVFERTTGFYIEGRGGVFFTVGGSRGYSNGQPFFGFEFGYDLTDRFSVQFGYASGYQAANPLQACDPSGSCGDYHLDFGLTFFNLSADYDLVSKRRWALELRAGGGVVLINPSAEPDQSAVDGDIFAGTRFEYYTLLKHFTLGAELDFYYIMPTSIPAFSVAVSVLYNF